MVWRPRYTFLGGVAVSSFTRIRSAVARIEEHVSSYRSE
jgi:hypothetical protein